jgi:hypothetical protein
MQISFAIAAALLLATALLSLRMIRSTTARPGQRLRVTVRDPPALVAVVVTCFGCWLMKEAESLKAHFADSLITAMSGRWLSCRQPTCPLLAIKVRLPQRDGSGPIMVWADSTKGIDMRMRTIGALEVSAVGLGAMGFSHGYGPGVGEGEAIELMRSAFGLGCTFYDTAEGYAAGENERLVGRALAPIRDQVVIATKFRVGDSASGAEVGRQIRARLEASLRRPGTEHVELYYQHRVSPSVPVKDVAAVMGELIAEGKIGGWGQSQASEDQVRRAHAGEPGRRRHRPDRRRVLPDRSGAGEDQDPRKPHRRRHRQTQENHLTHPGQPRNIAPLHFAGRRGCPLKGRTTAHVSSRGTVSSDSMR